MKKISAYTSQESACTTWAVGDLVKISSRAIDSLCCPDAGIIVSVETDRFYKQMEMFPMIKVFNFKTSQVNKIYSYNLEILSSRQ